MQVSLVDYMGSDLSVIQAAKASFGKVDTEFKPKEHTRLINYLARGMTQADYDELVKSSKYNKGVKFALVAALIICFCVALAAHRLWRLYVS